MAGPPGLATTSCHIFTGQSEDECIAFDCGAIARPFTSESQGISSRPPIICRHCGSFLSPYSHLNQDTGTWFCPFCRNENPKFCEFPANVFSTSRGDYLREVFPELQSKQCDFYEPSGTASAAASPIGAAGYPTQTNNNYGGVVTLDGNTYMFVLDQYNANDVYCLDMLKEAIASLQKTAKVILAVFGRSVNVFRLAGLLDDDLDSDSPITTDTIPGNTDKSQSISHLLQRGIHIATASFVVQNFNRIADALASIVPFTGRDNINRSVTNIRAVVGVGIEVAKATMSGLKLLIISCRSFFIDTKLGTEMAAFAGLGRKAAVHGCYIDVIHAGETFCRFDWLDALCGATGGCVCEGPSFSEDHIRLSLVAAVQRPGFVGASGSPWSSSHTPPFPCKNSVATLEIRTCPKLHVERLVGPVATEDDFAGLSGTMTKYLKIDSRAVDERHVKYTLESTRRARGHAVTSVHIQQEEELVMKQLQQYNAENTVICGLTRCEADVTVTLQAKPVDENNGGQNNSLAERLTGAFSRNVFGSRKQQPNGSGGYSSVNSTTASSDSFIGGGGGDGVNTGYNSYRDNEAGNTTNGGANVTYAHTPSASASSVSDGSLGARRGDHDCAYIQTVVRFLSLDGAVTVTRVWTAQLKATNDIDEYLQGLDEKAWAVVVARGLVADYHDSCISNYGSARSSSVLQGAASRSGKRGGDDTNAESIVDLRVAAMETCCNVVSDIVTNWNSDYHDPKSIREGQRAPSSSSSSFATTTLRDGKILSVSRALYHLHEGPLLDGPALSPQQSYLYRARFLYAAPELGSVLLQPRLQLGMVYAEDDHDISVDAKPHLLEEADLEEAPAESTSLLPRTVALIDFGDCIILRPGSAVSTNELEHLQSSLLRIAANRSLKRNPIAAVFLLTRAGSSNDRWVYPRLSPTHMDPSDTQLMSFPLLGLLTEEERAELKEYAPFTEQPTFWMYLSQVVPKYAGRLHRDMARQLHMSQNPPSMHRMEDRASNHSGGSSSYYRGDTSGSTPQKGPHGSSSSSGVGGDGRAVLSSPDGGRKDSYPLYGQQRPAANSSWNNDNKATEGGKASSSSTSYLGQLFQKFSFGSASSSSSSSLLLQKTQSLDGRDVTTRSVSQDEEV